jgi:hypothetical protein
LRRPGFPALNLRFEITARSASIPIEEIGIRRLALAW